MTTEITPRQFQVLTFIRAYIKQHGFPPSHGDIARHFACSRQAANQLVRALASAGRLRITPGVVRSIVLL